MSCPIGDHGQPLCNVVNHPDRAHESFCGTCQRRFIKQESNFGLGALLAAIAAILLILLGARSGSEQVDVGENDLPSPNTVSLEVIPPITLPSLPERKDGTEEALTGRIFDLPMNEQIDDLNGGDRIAILPTDEDS